jgi:hypothetical protein
VKDRLLLMRAPLAASAASNVLVGALLAVHAGAAAPPATLALLGLGACCAYWAGMVWNDVFDLARDRELAPRRPLPSGRVSLGTARLLGATLTLLGVGCTVGAAALQGDWRAGLLAGGALAAAVLAYDGLLKRWRLPGALSMGACRGVNALVGPLVLLGWGGLRHPLTLGYALALTVYVSALTWLSTWEDEDAPPWAVWSGYAALPLAHLGVALGLLFHGEDHGLHGLAALVLVPFPILAVKMLRATLQDGTQKHGKKITIFLLKLLWLFDFTAALAVPMIWPDTAAWLAVPALWLLGQGATKALFKPPPSPAT